MPWWYRFTFEKRRFKRELKELAARRPDATSLLHLLKGDGSQEIDRLALADVAEEEGYSVLARMIRDYLTTIEKVGKERWKRRRQWRLRERR